MKRALAAVLVGVACLWGLFALAGTAAWWNAWALLAFLAILGWSTLRLIRTIPGLEEERRTAGAKAAAWDVIVVRVINLALPAMLVVAALDVRFHWLPAVPPAVSVGALAMMVPATLITYRAIAENGFFSSHVRIQTERGHAVVSTGPYRVVRHPGYAGAASFNLLVPILLGSWVAMAPAIVVVVLLVYRTIREDRVLMADLPDYAEYARRVRWRFVPGVW